MIYKVNPKLYFENELFDVDWLYNIHKLYIIGIVPIQYALPNVFCCSFSVLKGQYKILDTDYKTYALAWQCDEAPLGVANMREYLYLQENLSHSFKNFISNSESLKI